MSREDCREFVARALESARPEFRVVAVELLPELEDDPARAVNLLLRKKSDPDEKVRSAAFGRLAEAYCDRALDDLLSWIREGVVPPFGVSFRGCSAESYSRLQDAALESTAWQWRVWAVERGGTRIDNPALVLREVLEVPGAIPRALELLLARAENDARAAKVIIELLNEDRPSLDVRIQLRPGLPDPPPATARIFILRKLKELALPESLPAIGRLLKHPSAELRNEALETLEAIERHLAARREWERRLGLGEESPGEPAETPEPAEK